MKKVYDPCVVMERIAYANRHEVFYMGRFDNPNEAIGYCITIWWEYQGDNPDSELRVHPMKYLGYDDGWGIQAEEKENGEWKPLWEYLIVSCAHKYGEEALEEEKNECEST